MLAIMTHSIDWVVALALGYTCDPPDIIQLDQAGKPLSIQLLMTEFVLDLVSKKGQLFD